MMGVTIGDARQLTLWQFTAMRTKWNARHRSPDERSEPPSVEHVRRSQAELFDLGIAGTAGSA